MNVNVASGTGVDLFRLRTAANGAIIKVFVPATGNAAAPLGLRRHHDQLRRAARHRLAQRGALRHGRVHTTWDLYRDGVLIVNDWAADTGTAAVGRIQIGDTAAKTFTVNFDHVVLDLVPGEAGADATPGPTTPGTPTGTSPSTGRSRSAGPRRPTTPRRSRTGSTATATRRRSARRPSTTFTDPGLTPGSSHTYAVDAVDSLNNPSADEPASAPITVSAGATPPIFSDDFAGT